MFDRSKSSKERYPERTIRVDAIPPPYRSPTYVVEPTLVPVTPCHENMYYAQERERERERARERERRPSCSDLFHNIDVIQRLGERFKGLNTTFSHSSIPGLNPNSNLGLSSSNSNTHNNTPAQTNGGSATAALAARITELEKEKEVAREREIENLSGGLNVVRGEIKGLQMNSEREEGRREGRMEGVGLRVMGAGGTVHGRVLPESWVNMDGELGRGLSQRGDRDRDDDMRRRIEALELQRERGLDGGLVIHKVDERAGNGRIEKLMGVGGEEGMRGLRDRDERGVRMDRFEDRVEGRVERVERMVEREIGRVGESDRDRVRRDRTGGRDRDRDRDIERYARPRIMREWERERDWEYEYESGNGYGGYRHRGYV
ncbi:hypothetical protein EYC80_007965 [Monilinia laxa]|uniref:Uncharacterized protein n=1 Tax=Monilinia laxa TaxID=61186 RepID=A0A5N6JT22_MONLA|nr:hypothetical protein EYC80_007965 [Monilinia laxa]